MRTSLEEGLSLIGEGGSGEPMLREVLIEVNKQSGRKGNPSYRHCSESKVLHG
jgi:hypothetical protein